MAQTGSSGRNEAPLAALFLKASTAMVMDPHLALKPLDPTAEST